MHLWTILSSNILLWIRSVRTYRSLPMVISANGTRQAFPFIWIGALSHCSVFSWMVAWIISVWKTRKETCRTAVGADVLSPVSNFRFPKDFWLNMNAGYMLPKIQLQGERSDFLFHGITLNKDFFHKKLTLSVYCKSPLTKTWKMENKTYNNAFTLYETENKVMREFGISVSYRFGSLTDTFKENQAGHRERWREG